jgi:hypothetical protein
MDSSTAAFYGLATVNIKRADGTLMSATPAAITQAINDATPNTDGTLALKYSDPNPAAYSMAMPTYMVAPSNTITPARGTALAGFLRYAVQNQSGLPAGYAPLSPTMVASSMKVADAIPALPPPKPSPSSTPAPPATPIPGPAPTPYVPLTGSGFTGTRIPLTVAPPLGSEFTTLSTPIPSSAPRPPTTGGPVAASAKPANVPKPAALDFAQLGDSSMGRYMLLSVVALGLIGLAAGTAIEVIARRRHFLAHQAADETGG